MSEINKDVTRQMMMAVRDVLGTAATICGRGAEVHQGRSEIFVFVEAQKAILEFMDDHPAMQKLRTLRLMEKPHD